MEIQVNHSQQGLIEMAGRLQKLWAPPPKMTVSEWADAERRLSPESAAEPGKYYTSRTEYARGIMDAFSDPAVKRVVAMTSAQVSKTTILENIIGFHMHHDPCPIMLVFPTQHLCEEFSKDRIAPMLRDTPALRGLVKESNAKKSGNTLLSKHFPGGLMVMGWPTSVATLAGRPIRLAIGDELDRWKMDSREGNPVGLLSKRTTAFWNGKQAFFSTPTIQGASLIEAQYQESDQRKFYIPCPHCSDRFVLTFEHLFWDEGEPTYNEDGTKTRWASDAWYQCPSCQQRIGDVDLQKSVRRGEWKAHAPFRGTAGFWIWEGYSPFSSALKIANQWLGAQGDAGRMIEVTNTVLGRTWKESNEAPAWEKVALRREHYKPGIVPEGALLLTAGVDIQGDRIEISVWGWGRDRHCWLVDHAVFGGRPEEDKPWEDLTAYIDQTWRHVSGAQMSLSRIAIDSGYASTRVHDWARRIGPSRVMVIRGYDHLGGVIVGQPSSVDISIRGKKIPKCRVWPVDVSKLKTELYGRLRLESPEEGGGPLPSGWLHLYEVPDEFCRQLVAERLEITKDKSGFGIRKMEWTKNRERNEAMDCWNYARAAAHVVGIDRFSERQWRNFAVVLGVPDIQPMAPQSSVPAPAAAPVTSAPVAAPQPAPPAPARVAPQAKPRMIRSSFLSR